MPPKKENRKPELKGHFPTREERQQLIDQLLAMKNDSQDNNQLYDQYIQSIRALNESMDRYYTPGEDGLPPTVEQKDKEKLLEVIETAARCGEDFLADVTAKGRALDAGVPNMVTQLQNMLSQDYETMKYYDPANDEMTLPELQQDARTQVIDLRDVELEKIGGNQSSRLPMTVVDVTGKEHRGMFTKASYVDVTSFAKKTLKEAGDLCADETTKEAVTGLFDSFRGFLVNNGMKVGEHRDQDPAKAGDELIFGPIFLHLNGAKLDGLSQEAQEKAIQEKMRTLMGVCKISLRKVPKEAWDVLGKGFLQIVKEPGKYINGTTLGLKNGTRLDQRNSAMSAVAGLLGVPKLVARSTNMKYLDKDGKEVEGTFMDFAEGLDLRGKNGEKLCGQVKEEDPFGPPYGINKDLADMQVLDYICGNVDRHAGNLTYRVNDKGRITGLQGIDNDSSFGVVKPDKDNGLVQLPGLNKFRVISQSMAEKVKNLTPEMLKFALRGRGLTEQEIDAACDRLKDVRELAEKAPVCNKALAVKANISAGKTVILTDDLMKGINPETFAVKSDKYVGNLFRKAVLATKQVLKSARKKGIKYDPNAKKNAPNLTEVSTTDRGVSTKTVVDTLQNAGKTVKGFALKGISKFLRSSGAFRSMSAAAKDLEKANKALDEAVKRQGKLDRSDAKVRELMDKADETMKKLRETTQAYLNKKMRERGANNLDTLVPKNDYEARRIRLARDVMEKVVDYDSRSASFTRVELGEKRQQKKAPEKTGDRTVSL